MKIKALLLVLFLMLISSIDDSADIPDLETKSSLKPLSLSEMFCQLLGLLWGMSFP